MKQVTIQESKELNEWIESFADEEGGYDCFGGKQIPYIGWYWRTVDFTEMFQLGWMIFEDHFLEMNDQKVLLEAAGDDVGFMENNKWSYAAWDTKQDVYEVIVSKLRLIKEHHMIYGKLSLDELRDFNTYMQSLKVRFKECQHCKNDRGMRQWTNGEDYDTICTDCRKYSDILMKECGQLYSHNFTESKLLEHFNPKTKAENEQVLEMWKYREYRFKKAEETNH